MRDATIPGDRALVFDDLGVYRLLAARAGTLLAVRDRATVRTIFVASPADERTVRELIEGGLAQADGWSVTSTRPRPVTAGEAPLARRLSDGPHL